MSILPAIKHLFHHHLVSRVFSREQIKEDATRLGDHLGTVNPRLPDAILANAASTMCQNYKHEMGDQFEETELNVRVFVTAFLEAYMSSREHLRQSESTTQEKYV